MNPESTVHMHPHPHRSLNNFSIFVQFFSQVAPHFFGSTRFNEQSGLVPVPSFQVSIPGSWSRSYGEVANEPCVPKTKAPCGAPLQCRRYRGSLNQLAGGFPNYYVPSSRTVSKRTPIEAPAINSSRGVLLLMVLDDATYWIGNPPAGSRVGVSFDQTNRRVFGNPGYFATQTNLKSVFVFCGKRSPSLYLLGNVRCLSRFRHLVGMSWCHICYHST